MTQSVKVTVSENSIGLVPLIELESISSTASYLGSAITIPLRAEANDLDGTISTVEFYVNGELIFSDTSRPFEAELTPLAIMRSFLWPETMSVTLPSMWRVF